MNQEDQEQYFVVCVNNQDYPASLEVKKIYQFIPDEQATHHQMIRVIDESNEDYLYPADYFVVIQLPQSVKQLFFIS
ncbi:hypothetical protein [Planktothrix sp. FACHB-1365]|uniref:hypothetical protein n=1 Tax=Planktothrix sp. FACHB-1365 TaxID=2692855 RepID=UPI0016880A5E|nr:hypothetical protein [Planktothrix sp. FACHB-1365]MBD2484968.1 hypothetical protein [Planktothrix sp. FACHB-1365]